MDYSFGQSVLMLYSLIEGMTLSYGYSNRQVPESVYEFQNLFRSMLANYIENHGWFENQFLNLNENFDFMQNSTYKMKE